MSFLEIPSLAFSLILVIAVNPSEEKKNDLAPKTVETKPVSDGFPLPPGAEFRFGNRQMRHPESIFNSTLSPDGKSLATSGNRVVVIWDTGTLKAKHVIKDQWVDHYLSMGLEGLHFTPDSKRLLISMPTYYSIIREGHLIQESSPLIAQVVDVETGKKQFDLPSFNHPNASWISASGKEIVSFSSGFIRHWTIDEGKEIKKFHLNFARTIPWTTNRVDRIALVENTIQKQKFKVYDTQTTQELLSIEEPDVVRATFSPDGKTLVFQTLDDKMHLYNLETKKEIGTFLHPEKKDGRRVAMYIAQDNRTLYFGSHNGFLFRWDLKENKKLANLGRQSSGSLLTMTTNNEEKMLYVMGMDKVIQRWDLVNNKQLPLPEGYMTQLCMTLSPDSKRLFIGDHSPESELLEWDLITGKRIKKSKGSQPWGVNCLGRSSDGKWLASGTVNQEVQLWDLSLGKVTKSIPLVEKPNRDVGDPVHRIEFSPDNKVLYVTSAKTGLSAYDSDSEKLLWRVPSGNEFACSGDGKWIVVMEHNQPNEGPIQFRLLDPATGKTGKTLEVQPLLQHKDRNSNPYLPWIFQFAVVPDGSALISSHLDGSVRVWDPDTARETRKFLFPGRGRNPLACSEDGRWIALGCPDTNIRIYELATGKEVLCLEGNDTLSSQLLFTKDSRSLISNADLAPLKWTLRPRQLPKLSESLEAIWKTLASEDSAKAYRLQWALIDHPALAIQLFSSKMKPEDFASDRNRFDQLLADLDSARFSVRESAQKEILAQGERFPIRWLTDAIQASKSAERKTRLQKVIELRPKEFSPDMVRIYRALYVLEQIHSPESRKLLQQYAQIADGNLLADQAKTALERSR
jgi:WD40 repeat protein